MSATQTPTLSFVGAVTRRSRLLGRLVASMPAAIAFVVLVLLAVAALLAPWIVRQNPYDLAALDLLDSHMPPAFLAGGDPRYWLGTDRQGADLVSLTLHRLRTSLPVG